MATSIWLRSVLIVHGLVALGVGLLLSIVADGRIRTISTGALSNLDAALTFDRQRAQQGL
jgi:hypothetical protein